MKDYDLIFDDLPNLIEKHKWNSILLGKKVAYSGGASYAIYNTIPSNKVTFDASPVMLMKAQKNEVQWKLTSMIELRRNILGVILCHLIRNISIGWNWKHEKC